MEKEIFRLWQCPTCRNELKINYIASKEDYDRIKTCLCGDTMAFIKDLKPGDKV